jgi:hypothetical protein
MSRTILTLIATFTLLLGFSPAAQAHTGDMVMWRPYVIEKTCNNHYKNCTVRMVYAKGQNPGTAKAGTYFYQKAKKGRHGDFRLTASGHRIPKGHYHKTQRHTLLGLELERRHHRHGECRKHGWGFDHRTGTFAWIPKRAKCIPNYDGR